MITIKSKEQLDLLQSIYDGIDTAIFVIDVTDDGDFRYAGTNPTHEKLLGITSDWITGKTPEELVPTISPKAATAVRANYQRCLDAQETIEYEEMLRIRGKNMWWLTRLTPLFDDDGTIYRIIGSSNSINRLKRIESKLIDERKHLEDLVEKRTQKLKKANEKLQKEIEERTAIEEELRVTNEQLVDEIETQKAMKQEKEKLVAHLQERMKELECLYTIAEITKDDTKSIEKALQECVNVMPPGWNYPEFTYSRIIYNDKQFTSKPFEETNFMQEANLIIGHERRGKLQVFLSEQKAKELKKPFLHEESNLIQGIAYNISRFIKKRITDQKINEQKERFLTIFNNFPEILYVVDPETYEVLFVNQAFEDMLGSDPVGDKCYEKFQGFDKPCRFCTTEKIQNTKSPYTWEYYNPILEKYLLITDQIIQWPDGRDVRFEVAIDITKRKQAEEKLTLTLKDLKRSNEELERFAYVASHDLQEPLRKVKSFTELFANKYKGSLDEKADRYIHYIVDGAERMQILINDILSFSRITTRGKAFEETNLQHILTVTLNNLSRMIEEHRATITYDKLPTVIADDSQMLQVFQNLIHNAIKFSGKEDPQIHISAKETSRFWKISVQDNGIGIESEYFDKIFVIFQRLHTRKEYSGTGIGLAICKKIIDRHGGEMWVESQEGKGSTFYFTLPK